MLYEIDWTLTAEMFSGIGTFLVGLAATVALFKAPDTISEYQKRQQLKALSERQHEEFKADRSIAIDILAAFEEGRQSIKSIRSLMSPSWEVTEVEKEIRAQAKKENAHISDEEVSNQLLRYTVIRRINQHQKTWDKIAKLLPLAKAVFAQKVKGLLFDVLKARREIYVSAEMFRHPLNDELRANCESKIWQMTDNVEEDPIESKLEESEKELERILTPYIRWKKNADLAAQNDEGHIRGQA